MNRIEKSYVGAIMILANQPQPNPTALDRYLRLRQWARQRWGIRDEEQFIRLARQFLETERAWSATTA